VGGSTIPTITTGIQTIDSKNNRIVVMDPFQGLKEFTFANVLPVNVSQKECYQKIGHPSVRDLLCGFNTTVFMYGQTGSGKTHTMMGTTKKAGILPLALQELFQAIHERRHLQKPIHSDVSVSYIELYGDEVTDLLRQSKKVAQNMAAAHRFVLEGQASNRVESFDHVMALLSQGELQKRVAATAMNERSSRAHSLFIVNLKQTCGNITHDSRLIFGDLGGAEQLKKSQPTDCGKSGDSTEDTNNWKARTQEAIRINMGLLALKKCVCALNQRDSYIPYRDSKLTMLLSPGLGQLSRTQIVVCASQDPEHAKESISSLQFAQACNRIELSEESNDRHRSTDRLLKDMLEDLDRQIDDCRERIRGQERWITERQEWPDGRGGVEIRSVSKMVGAEHLNDELGQLLQRRADLTGMAWTVVDYFCSSM